MAEDNLTDNPATEAAPEERVTPLQAFNALSQSQKITAIVAVALFIALLVGTWIWEQAPEYRVLYSNLSDRDGGAIIDSLQQQNIPYKFSEGGGALLVPSSVVHEVRLRLASQGLPKGSLVGFELMENQKFGTSQFLEQVNYQRALEGELARSMQTLAAVQAARIHLALPKPSVFVKEQQKPGASVVLTLFPGRALDSGQINGIIHLISSSVPDMPAKNVTVLDQSGSLLSLNKENSDTPLNTTQIKYIQQIEQDYIKRIEAILIPLVGANNVHAQLTADIDFAQAEQTAELYGPNQPPNEAAIRSQQTLESRNGGAQTPAGVPGSLTNQPPVPATAPIVNPANAVAEAAGGTGSSSRRESTSNYEVDRTIRYTKLPVGSIKRLSAAVIVNNRMITDKNGKTTSKPLTDSEREQITALVKEAMGFNASRGDSLNVLNSAFNETREPPVAELPLWKQPEMIALAKDVLKYLLIGGVILFLLRNIIRPIFWKIFPPPPKVPEVPPEQAAATAAAAAAEEARKSAELLAHQAQRNYEYNLLTVKKMAQQEPKVVAAVVKAWVSQDD